ncbi:MAG: dephospho-CoA kinase [Proteobacteria bacterium]|nr:dephospho-CoA kinase [Pseudomonadota bacterium]
MSLIVGLTGGIGSGKSTVADLLAARGAAVVDTDVIAHELTGVRGAAMGQIAAAFGPSVVGDDGALDRVAMRRLVFSDAQAKSRIEAILHPLIQRESEARCRLAAAAPYVLLVVPLLVESGAYRQRVDRILVVDCDEATQLARVIARSGLSAEEAQAIMATQASRAERLAVADDVVFNGGGRDDLNAQVVALHRRYLELAALAGKARIT